MIFDCDGVLVDGEQLRDPGGGPASSPSSAGRSARREVGRSLPRALRGLHAGPRSSASSAGAIDWPSTFDERHREAFEAELVAVEGVGEVVGRPRRAATSRSASRRAARTSSIAYKLARTGLRDAFRGRGLQRGGRRDAEPAPDVFLHAAREMGARPQGCAVVEDAGAASRRRRGRHVGLRLCRRRDEGGPARRPLGWSSSTRWPAPRAP